MGWQDDPIAEGWKSDPLVADAAKQQLAREISPMRAALIGAGAMGDRLGAGVEQAALGTASILSNPVGIFSERLKGRIDDYLTKRLLALEQEQKSKAEEYAKLQKERPVATTVGEIAPLLGAPMLRVVEGAGALPAMANMAASAALPGAVEYGTAGERAARAGAGAAGGAAGSGVLSVAGKGAQALTGIGRSNLTPEAARIAAEAERLDIPLTAGQATGNKAIQAAEAAMEWLPSTAGGQAAVKQGQREAFTRGVMKQMGSDASDVGPQAMEAVRKRVGGDFDRIFAKVKVDLTGEGIQQRLGAIAKDAAETMPAETAALVARRIEQIVGKVDESGHVSGRAYQVWRTQVQQQAEKVSDEWLGTKLRDVYRAVDEVAYEAAEKAGEAAALRTARAQYQAMKTVQPLAEKATDGIPSPALLQERVSKKYPAFAFGGGGDMGSLARIGKRFIADQVPNSGTAQRQLMQGALTGGLGFATGGDLESAAKYAAAGLAFPKMAQMAMNSGAGQRFLTQGFSPAEAAALRKLGGLSGLGVAEYLGP